jgi:PAS domain S-box-containing protein
LELSRLSIGRSPFLAKEEPLDIRRLLSFYIDVPALRPGTAGAYVLAVLPAGAAAVLRIAIDPYVAGVQYITFFPAVIITALISGFGAGLLCVVLSAAGSLFFLLPPSFYESPSGVADLLLFVLEALFYVILITGLRSSFKQYRELSLNLEQRVEERTRDLYETNRQLHVANDLFRAMYERGGIFAGRLDLEGITVDANPACVEGLGFARADIIGKPFWETGWWRISSEVMGCIHDRVERALAGEGSRADSSYVTGNGEQRVADVAMTPIKDNAGRVASVLVAGMDITERAQQYKATFENATVGIAHISGDLEWIRVNGALCRIVGYATHELVSRPVLDLVYPDYREAVLAAIEHIREGKIDSSDAEMRYLHKGGTTVWVRAAVVAVRRSDRSVDHFVGVFLNISERKRAEEELAKSEERFRSSILHSPVPTMLYDDREQLLAISESWLKAAGGILAGELHRMEDWTIRAYGEGSGNVLGVVREIIAAEPEARTDEMILTLGGDKRIWNFFTTSLGTLSDGRRLFVVVAEDVTDRKAYEERIELLMRESHHRIKNILSLVQAVARQTAARDPEHFVKSFTERTQALAANHDLLVDSKWQGADVEDLVRIQLAHFADLVGSRIAVHGPKLRLNAAAAQAVGLAVHELATNASKFGALSTDNGRVDVDWRTDARSFAISWTERSGPPVRAPDHRGFGSTVIELMAKRAVGAEVEVDYAPSGFRWHLTCPAANALEARADIQKS